MLKQPSGEGAPRVLLLEEPAVELAVTRRGVRAEGERCQLTIAVNGEAAASFLEEAGARAPRAAVIGVTAPANAAGPLLDALSTRPWLHPDVPVLAFAHSRGAGPSRRPVIGYLVVSGAVAALVRTIRETLDLPARPG